MVQGELQTSSLATNDTVTATFNGVYTFRSLVEAKSRADHEKNQTNQAEANANKQAEADAENLRLAQEQAELDIQAKDKKIQELTVLVQQLQNNQAGIAQENSKSSA